MLILEVADSALLKAKLVLKLTDIFSDSEVKKVILNTQVDSEEFLITICDCLKKFRPDLYQELGNYVHNRI